MLIHRLNHLKCLNTTPFFNMKRFCLEIKNTVRIQLIKFDTDLREIHILILFLEGIRFPILKYYYKRLMELIRKFN